MYLVSRLLYYTKSSMTDGFGVSCVYNTDAHRHKEANMLRAKITIKPVRDRVKIATVHAPGRTTLHIAFSGEKEKAMAVAKTLLSARRAA